MPYGTIKVDNITFDNGGTDKLITVSGLFFSTSGALTVTGTISGGNVTAPTATFTTLTGITTAGTTVTFTSGSFTSLTGVTTTGTTATFTSGSFTSLTGVTTTVTSGVFGLGSAAAPSIAFSGDTNNGIYSPGADQVAISTNGTGRLFVTSAGNLGVGVTTPGVSSGCTNIELAYGSTLSARSDTAAPQFAMMSNAVGNWYAPTYKINGYATQYLMQGNDGTHVWYRAASGTAGNAITFLPSMTLDASGRLGLGTSSPDSKLHVVDASGNSLRIGFGSNFNIYDAATHAFRNNGGTSDYMRIDSSGRVGIGTTNPAGIIDVQQSSSGGTVLANLQNTSNTASSNTRLKIATGGSSGGNPIIQFTDGNIYNWYINADQSDSNKLKIGTSISDSKFVMTTGGNVGIGTTSPGNALHVVSTANSIQYPIRLENSGTSGTTLGAGLRFDVYNGSSISYLGGVIASASTWSYGTYLANQISIVNNGSGGVRLAAASAPIVFHTGNADSDLSSERARIDSSGRLLVGVAANANGGILQLTSGITFPATAVAASDANTLDDYEEGTWTPTITPSASGTFTTINTSGTYTKTGRMVSLMMYVDVVSVGTALGSWIITGIPFVTATTHLYIYGTGANQATGTSVIYQIYTPGPNVLMGPGTGTTLCATGTKVGAQITYFV